MTREERDIRAKVKQELDDRIDRHGLVLTISTVHRERMFMMDQRKRCELALGSYLRRSEGWTKDKPEAERKEIAARVSAMQNGGIDPGRHAEIIDVSRKGSAAFSTKEDQETWKLEYLAKKLPVWEGWAKDVKGFGARSLGVIVGEAGDLSNYADHSKLWKRMGLAVMRGIRQGGLMKTASKDDWIDHGYNAVRRAHMFVIGDCLVKASGDYRNIYLARKEYERERAAKSGLIVLPSARIPKSDRDNYMSDGHIHKRAQRYMEKRLLRDLWKAWRRAKITVPETAHLGLPSAEDLAA
jgi:hypothetical protein